MPRQCTICNSPLRKEVDRALYDGESLRGVAGRFSLAASSVHRHKLRHLGAPPESLDELAERLAALEGEVREIVPFVESLARAVVEGAASP